LSVCHAFGQPDSVVGNTELDLIVFGRLDGNLDRAASFVGEGMFDRVGHELVHHDTNLDRVVRRQCNLGNVGFDIDGLAFVGLGDLADDVADVGVQAKAPR
jgi:hypothetical protein